LVMEEFSKVILSSNNSLGNDFDIEILSDNFVMIFNAFVYILHLIKNRLLKHPVRIWIVQNCRDKFGVRYLVEEVAQTQW